MKNLKKHLLLVLTLLFMSVVASSCLDMNNEDNGPTYYSEFVMINATDDQGAMWFEGDEGKYYPHSLPSTVNLAKYKGRRALIFYTLEDKKMDGYKKVIKVMAYQLTTIYHDVVRVNNQADLDALGMEPVSVDPTGSLVKGNWIDITVKYFYTENAKRKFTLVAPSASLLPPNAVVPADYTYMELRQSIDTDPGRLTTDEEIISFELPTEFNPLKNDGKGIYLGVVDLNGSMTFAKIVAFDPAAVNK